MTSTTAATIAYTPLFTNKSALCVNKDSNFVRKAKLLAAIVVIGLISWWIIFGNAVSLKDDDQHAQSEDHYGEDVKDDKVQNTLMSDMDKTNLTASTSDKGTMPNSATSPEPGVVDKKPEGFNGISPEDVQEMNANADDLFIQLNKSDVDSLLRGTYSSKKVNLAEHGFDVSSTATIVSVFYSLKLLDGATAKHKHSAYVDWARAFLKTPSPIIIFTNEPVLFASLRPKELHKVTRIISLDFWNVPYMQKVLGEVKRLFHRDPFRATDKISPELTALWYSKVEFVKLGVLLNPYNTEKFVWTDVGSRRENVNSAPLPKTWNENQYPHPTKYMFINSAKGRNSDDFITMFNVPTSASYVRCKTLNWFTSAKAKKINPANFDLTSTYTSIRSFPNVDKFMELFRFFKSDRKSYKLDDQYHMQAVACLYPELVQVIFADGVVPNEWFYYTRYFSVNEPDVHYEQDTRLQGKHFRKIYLN